MDRIPLINPNLIKVSTVSERASVSVLRAEVISSTPVKQSQDSHPTTEDKNQSDTTSKNARQSNIQEYKVVLKIGQQQLETISKSDFEKGSHLKVKILPGPELKIINGDQDIQKVTKPVISQAKMLVQQLLADRIPQIQQQELPNLIKQLSQIINSASNSSQTTTVSEHSLEKNSHENNQNTQGAKFTNQQALGNQRYLQQSKLFGTKTETTDTKITSANTAVQQVKAWLQQLPKEHDISNSTGLRDALNNAGPQAEKQLRNLAQQSLNMTNKQSANNIFQQLQSLQKGLSKDLLSQNDVANYSTKEAAKITNSGSPNLKAEFKTDLASIVKRTAKALSDNSQIVLSSLIKSKPTNTSTNTPTTPSLASGSSKQSSVAPYQWQNPLLNNSAVSLNDLLNAPLLQNPSSNNKFALGQILTRHNEQPDSSLRIPLNWPERAGNDAPLIRTLQNLLGHIEREQIQQMQSAEANQGNNPNQLQPNQQWVPLLINHQQQLQLIEFYMDKEERQNEAGEKKHHWFINLHFNLPKLGQLGIEISMFDNECNTTFWSESSSTLNQLSQHIQPLRQSLTKQGIIVTDIQSRHGTLEKRKNNIEQRLIDIKT